MMEEKAKKGLAPYVTPEIMVYDMEMEQSVLAGSDPMGPSAFGFSDTLEEEELW